MFVFFFDGDAVDEAVQDGAHGFKGEFATEEIFGEDLGCGFYVLRGHGWCGLVAGIDQLVVFGEDDGTFAFEVAELVHEGLAAATIGDGVGGVGDLGGELFLFGFEDREALGAFAFAMLGAVTFDFEHGGEAFGQEDLLTLDRIYNIIIITSKVTNQFQKGNTERKEETWQKKKRRWLSRMQMVRLLLRSLSIDM